MNTMKVAMSLVLMVGMALSGCTKDNANGRIMIRMTDAPGPYQQVNVEILQVKVSMDSPSGDNWVDLPTNAGIYNLLDLQNGIDTTIVNLTTIQSGTINQMRLLLGSNNTVMVDSVLHPMKVPSGTQTGIKIVTPIHVSNTNLTNVLIDFIADKSVVESGNGDYHLKPVIKVVE